MGALAVFCSSLPMMFPEPAGSCPAVSQPYTFLEPAISGVEGVALFIAGMVVAFVLIGYLIFAIDRVLGRIAKSKTT